MVKWTAVVAAALVGGVWAYSHLARYLLRQRRLDALLAHLQAH